MAETVFEGYVYMCTTLFRLLACKLKLHTSVCQTNTERCLRALSTEAWAFDLVCHLLLSGIPTLQLLIIDCKQLNSNYHQKVFTLHMRAQFVHTSKHYAVIIIYNIQFGCVPHTFSFCIVQALCTLCVIVSCPWKQSLLFKELQT